MAKTVIKFEGVYELQQGLQKRLNLDAVKTVVQKNGDQLNEKMKQNAKESEVGGVFAKGYSHGETRDSINTEILDNGLTAAVGPTTEYHPYVELGTRLMEAEPFIKPAWEDQKEIFKSDMDKLVK